MIFRSPAAVSTMISSYFGGGKDRGSRHCVLFRVASPGERRIALAIPAFMSRRRTASDMHHVPDTINPNRLQRSVAVCLGMGQMACISCMDNVRSILFKILSAPAFPVGFRFKCVCLKVFEIFRVESAAIGGVSCIAFAFAVTDGGTIRAVGKTGIRHAALADF